MSQLQRYSKQQRSCKQASPTTPLLCYPLQEVGTDGYDAALCLMGRQPVGDEACGTAGNDTIEVPAARGL